MIMSRSCHLAIFLLFSMAAIICYCCHRWNCCVILTFPHLNIDVRFLLKTFFLESTGIEVKQGWLLCGQMGWCGCFWSSSQSAITRTSILIFMYLSTNMQWLLHGAVTAQSRSGKKNVTRLHVLRVCERRTVLETWFKHDSPSKESKS